MAETTRPTFLRHSALGFGPLARNLDAEVTRSWMEPLRTDPAIRADTARFMAGIDKADLLDVSTRLSAFTRPVRLVWGDGDRFFKLDFAHRLAETFPSARADHRPRRAAPSCRSTHRRPSPKPFPRLVSRDRNA